MTNWARNIQQARDARIAAMAAEEQTIRAAASARASAPTSTWEQT